MLKKYFWYYFIFLSALLFRIPNIASKSMRYDELATTAEVFYPLKFFVFEYCLGGTVVPFFYLLVRPLVYLFGDSEITFRIIPLFAGTLTPVLMYHLLKKFNHTTAIIASASSILAVKFIDMSQEARPYSLLILLSIFFLYYLIISINDSNFKNRFLYILSGILIFYTSHAGGYFAVSTILLTGIYLLSFKRIKKLKSLIINSTLIALLYLPWFVGGTYKIVLKEQWWVRKPTNESVFYILQNLMGGNGITMSLILLTILFSVLVTKDLKLKKTLILSSLLYIGVVSLFLLKSLWGASIFQVRYLYVTIPLIILSFSLALDFLIKKHKGFWVILYIFIGAQTYQLIEDNPYVEKNSYKKAFEAMVKEHMNRPELHNNTLYYASVFSPTVTWYYLYKNIEFKKTTTHFHHYNRTWCKKEKEVVIKNLKSKSTNFIWVLEDTDECNTYQQIKEHFQRLYSKQVGSIKVSLFERLK